MVSPADLRLLLNYREQLIRERTRLANRLHSDLVSRYPGYQGKVKNLVDVGGQRAAEELLLSDSSVAGALGRCPACRGISVRVQPRVGYRVGVL